MKIKKMFLPFKAVVFDLDGTLIDSAADVMAALNNAFSPYNVSFSLAEIKQNLAGGLKKMVQDLAMLVPLPLSEAEVDLLMANYLNYYQQYPAKYTTLFPGVRECLESLQAHQVILAICSNKPTIMTHLVLKTLKLDQYFSCIIAAEDTPRKKPDPIHLRLVLEKISVLPKEAVMVGDAEPDVRAAQAAGVPVVLFSHSIEQSIILKPDATFSSFFHLIDILHTLRNFN